MHYFEAINGELYCEDLPLSQIAEQVGTPTYIYSHRTLERHFRIFSEALGDIPHLICYSMKANSNRSILQIFLNRGGGLDIVSGGELYRAIQAGASPQRIVFSGVGKTSAEIAQALQADILMFNVESEGELNRIQEVAKNLGIKARIALRVNPDIDPKTHPYIATGLKKSKFGIAIQDALRLFQYASTLSHIEVSGVDCHIGSQITELNPFIDALHKLKELIHELREEYHLPIRFLDLGGGLGIPYHQETPPHPDEYAARIREETRDLDCTLIFEPGRVLVGNAGILLTEVQYLKQHEEKTFVIVDAGMNALIRPALYQAWQAIRPVKPREGVGRIVDVVGPICESGDFLALDRELPPVEPGDLLAVMSSGAYGFSMASQYNSYPRPAEVLVKGHEYAVIRERENYSDLIRSEQSPHFEL
ncbi:diaminopimelate decarboxylase [bacterium (Candidatus Blackallbacteria) CG17_big_fil_post_rev_8_21_14_2_50_48_46]|uniref:Diaminopimelate decarboxylase n=1 Tax=bacterium (Candidatus Blackallbacteria) CG17_big_fil_post_rev_8_21_14_2_50_48_46 TaxID=2014261 RepID=A0A2M7G3Q4_9BACT|nr:MAG: diaminopimelate decarboxylase [bacterium (Candidatus Blackallbacteria) CG18_big_fil_WC_8_21_14_2_50_49_26]PIW16495.1 MAG: diaminopimelate decarboxylase [bacterium (Candidatus Blackallbacteria) CG17_big_fil_post_rev_8_21_14_2_50_48_46]PIW46003.1 MAG: diaminopimelate decarboxylase [bacterium (Candidatus Blackallbacteria) CG13_big_fil_rev_8_21_14_2_50_49_14]